MKKASFKPLIILICCMLSINNVIAQLDYRSGYVITNSTDTIKGYILYKDINASKKCSFKKMLVDKPIDYAPGDILSFRFDDGKYFISKETPLKKGNTILFLEYLIKGKANIYFMKDDGEEHYFIETDKNKIIELTQPEEFIKVNESDATPISPSGTYKRPSLYTGKLKYMLSDCPDIYPEIERVKLNHSSLIKLAEDYHNKVCNSEKCIIFERKDKHVKINFGLLAGVSLNSFDFGHQIYTNYSIGSLIGCRLYFENILFSVEHTSLQVGFILQKFSNYKLNAVNGYESYAIKYNGENYTLSPFNDPIKNINVKMVALKIPVTYNYIFLISKIRPYIGGGFTNMYILSQNNELEVSKFMEEYGKSIPSFHIGIIGIVGSKYILNNNHFLFLEFTYELTQNMNVNEFLRLTNNNFSIVSGFAF